MEISNAVNATSIETRSMCNNKLKLSNRFLLRVTFLPAVIVAGIFFNGLSYEILKRQSSQHRSIFLLRALAVADVSFLVVKFFREFLRPVLDAVVYGLAFQRLAGLIRNTRFAGFFGIYLAMFFFNRSTKLTRNWITVLIAMERVISLGFPLFAQAHITKRRLYICICVQYVLFACFGISFMLDIGDSTYWFDVCTGIHVPFITRRKLSPIETRVRFYVESILTSVFTNLLPILCLVILNTILIIVLKRIGKNREHLTRESKYRNIDQKATKMAIAVIVLFIVLESATSLGTYIKILRTLFGLPKLSSSIRQVVSSITNVGSDILTPLDSSVNYFVYCLTNDRFRNEAKKIFKRKVEK
ncbi:uncharacterized protein LOC141904424 [Tubulanus polymorphus]|uniref:uncharacterized protein LOC141904424 n=1 Tax=Tubulanus polymorphus TaxID=672921 RepID=UPI003DA2A521